MFDVHFDIDEQPVSQTTDIYSLIVPPLVTHRTIRSSYHRATAHKLTLTCNTAPIHLSWSTTKEKRKKIKERRKKKNIQNGTPQPPPQATTTPTPTKARFIT